MNKYIKLGTFLEQYYLATEMKEGLIHDADKMN